MAKVAITIEDVEKAVSLPHHRWKRRCLEVAGRMLQEGLVEGELTFGLYGTGLHAWIKLPDGRICDPTRWVEDGKEPYIYIGKNSSKYDECAREHHRRLRRVREAIKHGKPVEFRYRRGVGSARVL